MRPRRAKSARDDTESATTARTPGVWWCQERQRLALGATRRVAAQFFPALTVDVCDSPAVGAASPISLGSTWPSPPALGASTSTYPPSATGVFASTSASTRDPSPPAHHT